MSKQRVILNNGNLLNSQSLFFKQIAKKGWKMLAGYNVYFKKLYIGDILKSFFSKSSLMPDGVVRHLKIFIFVNLPSNKTLNEIFKSHNNPNLFKDI